MLDKRKALISIDNSDESMPLKDLVKLCQNDQFPQEQGHKKQEPTSTSIPLDCPSQRLDTCKMTYALLNLLRFPFRTFPFIRENLFSFPFFCLSLVVVIIVQYYGLITLKFWINIPPFGRSFLFLQFSVFDETGELGGVNDSEHGVEGTVGRVHADFIVWSCFAGRE